jgi:hypothetical protein
MDGGLLIILSFFAIRLFLLGDFKQIDRASPILILLENEGMQDFVKDWVRFWITVKNDRLQFSIKVTKSSN